MKIIEILGENIVSGLIYWVACVISILLAFIYQKTGLDNTTGRKSKVISRTMRVMWSVLIIILPSLFAGLRNYNLNYDTKNYVIGFLNAEYKNSLLDVVENVINGSPLFFIFRYLVFTISNGNPTVFLFLLAFITLFILVRGLDKWKNEISLPMALFVYYAFFGMQLLNQSRQMLALSILLFSLYYLLNYKYIKYFTIIVIASLIHFTALIGLILPLLNFKYTRVYPLKKLLFSIFLVISPILFYPLFKLMSFLIPTSYDSYLSNVNFDGLGFGLILNIGPILLPLLFFYRYFNKKDVAFLERMAFLSFPFRLSGYFSYFMMRMYYYGAIASVILTPLMFRRLKNKSMKYSLAFFVVFIYSVYYMINYLYLDQSNIFPYKSVFSKD